MRFPDASLNSILGLGCRCAGSSFLYPVSHVVPAGGTDGGDDGGGEVEDVVYFAGCDNNVVLFFVTRHRGKTWRECRHMIGVEGKVFADFLVSLYIVRDYREMK